MFQSRSSSIIKQVQFLIVVDVEAIKDLCVEIPIGILQLAKEL